MTGTNATRDPGSVLAAWLDEGPTDLPDATRRAILTALATTPQGRRGPFAAWRFQAMSPLARGAAAVLIAAVALGGVYLLAGLNAPSVGGPSSTPSASPIDTTGWQVVTSRRFGITYKIPAGWIVGYSTDPWTYSGIDTPGTVGADFVRVGQDGPTLSVASQRLPTGVDQATWFATYLGSVWGRDCMGPSNVSGFVPTTLDGKPAYEWDAFGPGPAGAYTFTPHANCGRAVVIAFDGGRAYRLEYDPLQAVDLALLRAWLSTVHLTPGNAVDAPSGASVGPPPG